MLVGVLVILLSQLFVEVSKRNRGSLDSFGVNRLAVSAAEVQG